MLNYKDYFSKLRSGELPQALLFDGEEEYTKDSALAQLRAKVLPEGLEEMNETPLSGTASAAEIVDACEMLPFLSPKRLVVVRGSALVQKTQGAAKDEGLDRLLQYLDHLPEHVILLFFCRGEADAARARAGGGKAGPRRAHPHAVCPLGAERPARGFRHLV